MNSSRFGGLTFLIVIGAAGCDRAGQSGATTMFGPAPAFDYVTNNGCSRFVLVATNRDSSEALIVSADLDRLKIKDGVGSFDLTKSPETLSVTVHTFPRPQRHLHVCTDFTDPSSDEPLIWTAVRGKITLERFRPEPNAQGAMPTFRIKATIEDAEFRDPLGRPARCGQPLVVEATVGWFPG